MEEPFRSLYWILITQGFHLDGHWHFGVNATEERIMIGTDDHHFTVLRGVNGYHATVGGHHDGQRACDYETFLNARWDVTPLIGAALDWFRDHPSPM